MRARGRWGGKGLGKVRRRLGHEAFKQIRSVRIGVGSSVPATGCGKRSAPRERDYIYVISHV